MRHTLPQKVHWYLLCWEISYFLTTLRRVAPYRVPYLPTTPAFLVRLPCKTRSGLRDGRRRKTTAVSSPLWPRRCAAESCATAGRSQATA